MSAKKKEEGYRLCIITAVLSGLARARDCNSASRLIFRITIGLTCCGSPAQFGWDIDGERQFDL